MDNDVDSSTADLRDAEELVTTNVEAATTSAPSNTTLDICATAVAQLKTVGLSQSNVKRSMEEIIFEIQSGEGFSITVLVSTGYRKQEQNRTIFPNVAKFIHIFKFRNKAKQTLKRKMGTG